MSALSAVDGSTVFRFERSAGVVRSAVERSASVVGSPVERSAVERSAGVAGSGFTSRYCFGETLNSWK